MSFLAYGFLFVGIILLMFAFFSNFRETVNGFLGGVLDSLALRLNIKKSRYRLNVVSSKEFEDSFSEDYYETEKLDRDLELGLKRVNVDNISTLNKNVLKEHKLRIRHIEDTNDRYRLETAYLQIMDRAKAQFIRTSSDLDKKRLRYFKNFLEGLDFNQQKPAVQASIVNSMTSRYNSSDTFEEFYKGLSKDAEIALKGEQLRGEHLKNEQEANRQNRENRY